MLIACRIGPGPVRRAADWPMSQTLPAAAAFPPPSSRTAAMGPSGAMTTLAGPAAGPRSIGGYISATNISWHWIFFHQPAVAAFLRDHGAICCCARWRRRRARCRSTRSGWACLLIFWIGCLQVMLDIGPRSTDWFGDPKIVMLAIGAAVGFLRLHHLLGSSPRSTRSSTYLAYLPQHRGLLGPVCSRLAFGFGAYFAFDRADSRNGCKSSMGYTATKAGLITAFTAISRDRPSRRIAAKMIGLGRSPDDDLLRDRVDGHG